MSCGTASFLHVLNIINLSFDTYDIGLRAPHQTPNTVVWSNWMMASNEQEGDQRETIIQKTCPWWSMCLVKDGWDFCLIHLWHMRFRTVLRRASLFCLDSPVVFPNRQLSKLASFRLDLMGCPTIASFLNFNLEGSIGHKASFLVTVTNRCAAPL